MEQKDPKDMTASELLRLAANGYDGSSGIVMVDLANFMGLGRNARHSESLYKLADKIDAELAQARKEAVNESKKPMWWFRSAIKRGEDWPEPRDGEKFLDYLHRCFLPRPRFEDGEPVQLGDRVLAWGEDHTVERIGIEVRGGGCLLLKYIDSPEERLERPAPEALGADGMPIKAGETVWHVIDGREATVANLKPCGAECDLADDMCDSVVWDYENITHTPPETQERIDEDASLPPREYYVRHIGHDVAEKGAVEVHAAVTAHLLKRQREIDAKGAI